MKPYLDAGFLLVLIARTPGTQAASEILREIAPPVAVTFLHQLQVENMLVRLQKDPDPALQVNGNQGFRIWNQYLAEGVFSIASVEWEIALRNAITWNRLSPQTPPSPWLFIHPALAVSAGASHFCSFDPRSRAIAHSQRMALLPQKL